MEIRGWIEMFEVEEESRETVQTRKVVEGVTSFARQANHNKQPVFASSDDGVVTERHQLS